MAAALLFVGASSSPASAVKSGKLEVSTWHPKSDARVHRVHRVSGQECGTSSRSRSAGSPYLKGTPNRNPPGAEKRDPPRMLLRKKAPNQGKALASERPEERQKKKWGQWPRKAKALRGVLSPQLWAVPCEIDSRNTEEQHQRRPATKSHCRESSRSQRGL